MMRSDIAIENVSAIKESNKELNLRERAALLSTIQSLPLVAKIEVTNRCNLRCIMCQQTTMPQDGRDLDVKNFEKLAVTFPTLLSAYLYGIGEVLLYPHLMTLFHHLIAFDVNVGLITNGQLIDWPMAEEWVQKGLYKLSLSIDGATAHTYETIRKGASYAVLLDTVSMINELKRSYNTTRPRLTFNFVVMRDTVAELPALIDLAHQYQVAEVIVSDLIVFSPAMKAQSIRYDDPLCLENFKVAKQRAAMQGIELYLPGPFRFQEKTCEKTPGCNDNHAARINPCTEPWSGFWLTGDGIVTPCCYWAKAMGDLKQDDFLSIWNNEAYQHLRQTVNTAARHKQCRQCAIAGMEKRA